MMVAAKAGEARRMVETPTTAACRTERRGYGRQLGINSAAVTLGGNLESNLDRGAGRGRDGARDAIVRTIEATRKEIGGGSTHSNRSRSERSVAIARLEAADYVTAATSSAPRIGFFIGFPALIRTFLRPSREATGATAFLAATLTGALAATAEPRKVEVMAAILYK